MRKRCRRFAARLIGCAIAGALVCGGFASAADWRDNVTFTLSDRARVEVVDWFDPPGGIAASGAERYWFFAKQLRAGVRVDLPHAQVAVEAQDTRLVNLPDDATLPPPQGALGPGALYFLNRADNSIKATGKTEHPTLPPGFWRRVIVQFAVGQAF